MNKKDNSRFETFDLLAKDQESIVLVRCESVDKNAKSNFADKLETLKGAYRRNKKNIV